jgi:hypothetical protein
MLNRAETIRSLTEGVSDEQARWKPGPDSWSILEVINHVYDEEIEDFRARIDVILHHPDQPWRRIDPQGWVTERQYNERDLGQSVGNFVREREKSVTWLRGLGSPNWQVVYEAPFGEISAGDVLVSWAAHDLLHIRQMVELQWAYIVRRAQPFEVDYAGEW